MKSPLFTIGYEKRTVAEFVKLLRAKRVNVLLDVRDRASSRKPGFSKTALAAAVAKAGIEYVHARFAGNPREFRAAGGSTAELLGRYARHLDRNPQILEEFTDLVATLHEEGKRVCIACVERDPEECHRGVLAKRWSESTGMPVTHLE